MDKKILHIVAGNLTGGAARGAYWLHKGLLDAGINSKMLINSIDDLEDETITSTISNPKQKLVNKIHAKVEQLPLKIYKDRKKYIFSTALQGYDITRHPLYEWANIIHLHWINNGFINIKDLKKIKKPIVWTMRDMWPFTGGCHYSMECNNYITGCGSCIQLGSKKKYDLSHYIVNRKQRNFPKNMTMVGISNWLSNKARESTILSDYDIRTIYNNIDCNSFFPVNKTHARKILGIETEKKVILCGAQNINDFYKGFEKYLTSLSLLNKDQFLLLFFGKLKKSTVNNIGFEYIDFGFLYDTISLRLLYSAADVFVAPSLMEAFGKTIAEAMACGTPVVCFDSGGQGEIVEHKQDGYKAIAFDAIDLSNGIKWIVEHPNPNVLAQKARDKIKLNYDVKVIVKKYQELYDEILSSNIVID
jgi:glycosyltransferase involved in cell wall biosynthesis